uniref:Uncharacterized protein n=1 Tax=Anguilla anguilla TaxID=7936 RepID=A0A0E9XYB8_ANGAN
MSAECTPTLFLSAEQLTIIQQYLLQFNGYNWVKNFKRNIKKIGEYSHNLNTVPEPWKQPELWWECGSLAMYNLYTVKTIISRCTREQISHTSISLLRVNGDRNHSSLLI